MSIARCSASCTSASGSSLPRSSNAMRGRGRVEATTLGVVRARPSAGTAKSRSASSSTSSAGGGGGSAGATACAANDPRAGIAIARHRHRHRDPPRAFANPDGGLRRRRVGSASAVCGTARALRGRHDTRIPGRAIVVLEEHVCAARRRPQTRAGGAWRRPIRSERSSGRSCQSCGRAVDTTSRRRSSPRHSAARRLP